MAVTVNHALVRDFCTTSAQLLHKKDALSTSSGEVEECEATLEGEETDDRKQTIALRKIAQSADVAESIANLDSMGTT